MVDIIPLVYYIPPPPDEPLKPIAFPPEAYSYPPKPSKSVSQPPKRRFRFFPFTKRSSKSEGSNVGTGSVDSKSVKSDRGNGVAEDTAAWEDNWEKGDYPFVRLEGNRAVCAICLMDFDEPKKVGGVRDSKMDPDLEAGPETDGQLPEVVEERNNDVQEVTVEPAPSLKKERMGAQGMPGGISGPGDEETTEVEVEPDSDAYDERDTEEEERGLKLEDAGEGPQPLRLLVCGHVFHVSGIIYVNIRVVLMTEHYPGPENLPRSMAD